MALQLGLLTPSKLFVGVTEVTKAFLGTTEVYSSAPALWTPAALGAALSLWFDADDASTITLNGSTVSQQRDKSGNNSHVSQSTAGLQPDYLAADLNGKAGIDFYLNKGLNTTTSNPVVGFVITVIKARNATWNNFHTMLESRTSQARIGGIRQNRDTGFHFNVYPSAIWEDGASKTISTSGFNTINSPHIIAFTSASGRGNPITGVVMGNYDTTSSAGGSGVQYETIALSTAPSTDDRQKLEGYLAWKWGTVASLPAGHPYKLVAPTV